MSKQQSLTKRAAAMAKADVTAAQIASLRGEISRRIEEVNLARKAMDAEIDAAMDSGDLEAVRSVRQSQADLKDEDTMLHRLFSELHRRLKAAEGQEAVAASADHRKKLEEALAQAEQALETLKACRREAARLITVRRKAAEIGEVIVFDADTIRRFSEALSSDPNHQKQMLIDLGIREANKAAKDLKAAEAA